MVRLTAFTAATLLWAVAPSLADECRPQHLIQSLDMTPVPGGGRVTVPVSINGVTKNLLLDTGAGMTSLTATTGDALSLRPQYIDDRRLLDSDGNASTHYFTVKDFQLGEMRSRDMAIIVTPDPHLGKDPPLDGILAPDLMKRFDVELDFVAGKLNYFSPDHCPERVIYWPAPSAGFVPVTVHQRADDMSRSAPVVQHIDLSGQAGPWGQQLVQQLNDLSMAQTASPPILGLDLVTTVTLDGKQLTAVIDTGAEMSILNSTAARAAFDVTAESPGSTPVSRPTATSSGTEGRKGVETVIVTGSRDAFEHTFHTLSFGGVTVTAPHFLVRPDRTGANDPSNDFQTGSHIARIDDVQRPDISIGMDVLKHLHLYFAFKEGRLYVTPAGPAQSAAN